MKPFDYIIAGGGAAGLSLLLNILRSDLKDRSVLLVDREPKSQNDRTWCFWSDQPTGLEDIYHHSWKQIQFISPSFQSVIPLKSYSYHMIRGIDFYRYVLDFARGFSNVTVLLGTVTHITENKESVSVTVNGKDYYGDYLFDSIIKPGDFLPDLVRCHNLKQHFLGWEIETLCPCFDPQTPILFDFRTPQDGAMRFMYILPASPYQALVEYTLFSPTILAQPDYEQALKLYLTNQLGIKSYKITGVEQGVIPMTDFPFPRRGGNRILNIGTKGGRVKPSTGYAFFRIQQDSAAIVQSLHKLGHPFHIPNTSPRYRLFDSILLQIMLRHPDDCAGLFTAMFEKNPVDRLFRFLNESGPVWNDLSVILSLPPYRFLQALGRLMIGRI